MRNPNKCFVVNFYYWFVFHRFNLVYFVFEWFVHLCYLVHWPRRDQSLVASDKVDRENQNMIEVGLHDLLCIFVNGFYHSVTIIGLFYFEIKIVLEVPDCKMIFYSLNKRVDKLIIRKLIGLLFQIEILLNGNMKKN